MFRQLCAPAPRRLLTPGLPQSTPFAARSSLRLHGSAYRAGSSRIGKVRAACGAPQAFEVVILPSPLREDMHDEASEIEQHPFGAGCTFAMPYMYANPGKLLLDLIADGI